MESVHENQGTNDASETATIRGTPSTPIQIFHKEIQCYPLRQTILKENNNAISGASKKSFIATFQAFAKLPFLFESFLTLPSRCSPSVRLRYVSPAPGGSGTKCYPVAVLERTAFRALRSFLCMRNVCNSNGHLGVQHFSIPAQEHFLLCLRAGKLGLLCHSVVFFPFFQIHLGSVPCLRIPAEAAHGPSRLVLTFIKPHGLPHPSLWLLKGTCSTGIHTVRLGSTNKLSLC